MKTHIVGPVLVLVTAAIVAGCAKQPRTAALAAPAPTGAAESTAAPPAVSEAPKALAAPPAVETPHPENVAVQPAPREFAPTPKLRDIHFDFDRYAIRPEDSNILDANIDWMQSNPEYLILIEGHCDERGTNEYNLALGDHRAKATMNYLMSHGVGPERITTISYGEERPLCVERTEACWARNRRAHFLVRLEKRTR